MIEDTENIINEYNDYFVNVGHNLAKEISAPGGNDKTFDSTSNKCNSMFLGGVCESDILDVVSKFKSKKSTD